MARRPLLFGVVLGAELARWALARRTPAFWWRDDDAREPTPALDRLLALATRHEAPLTIAAIAGPELPSLVRRVAETPGVEIAVHGFTHENRRPAGEGRGEILDSDSIAEVRARLMTTVALFHRAGAAPTLFTPPWNSVTPQLLAALPGSSLTALSGFEAGRDLTGDIVRIDTHLDVLRWKDGPRFRGAWRFLQRLRRLLAERRRLGLWDEPIGLLTHHLDHDAATWRFLEQMLAALPMTSRRALTPGADARSSRLSA